MLAGVLVLSTVLLCGIDLWCKAYVEKHFKDVEEHEICGGKIVLRKVHNEGMALNIGDKKPQIVRIVSGIICAVLTVYDILLLKKGGNLIQKTGMMWILAGAFSNCYDRFVRKYVVDYFCFQTKWKKLRDITFNLGDMFIFLGSIIFITAEIMNKKVV